MSISITRPSQGEAEALILEWRSTVIQLQNQVRTWIEETKGSAWQVNTADVNVEENTLGRYHIPVMEFETVDGRLVLEPIARDVIGARGRIDLYAWPSLFRVMLLHGSVDEGWTVRTDSGIDWPAPGIKRLFLSRELAAEGRVKVGYLLVRRLASVRTEYDAANAALRLVAESWHTLSSSMPHALQGVPLHAVQTTRGNLERTYETRLFSEFEQILRAYLQARRETVPNTAKALIDKVASRKRANILNEIRNLVHQVREYRNDFVHSGFTNTPALAFRDALSALNKFVSQLPDA